MNFTFPIIKTVVAHGKKAFLKEGVVTFPIKKYDPNTGEKMETGISEKLSEIKEDIEKRKLDLNILETFVKGIENPNLISKILRRF